MGKNLHISSLLDIYGRFLSEKQRTLTEYYYNDDLSLSEIAENEGITRQGVCDNIKRAEMKMLSWEAECGYCEKISKLKTLSEDEGNMEEIIGIINDL